MIGQIFFSMLVCILIFYYSTNHTCKGWLIMHDNAMYFQLLWLFLWVDASLLFPTLVVKHSNHEASAQSLRRASLEGHEAAITDVPCLWLTFDQSSLQCLLWMQWVVEGNGNATFSHTYIDSTELDWDAYHELPLGHLHETWLCMSKANTKNINYNNEVHI